MIVARPISPDPSEARTAADEALFRSWGEDSPRPVGVGYFRSPPEPCLVCGAPLNSCTYEDHQLLRAQTRQVMLTKEIQQAMRHQTRLQGTTDANTDPTSNLYLVPDDVVEEYFPAGSARPSWRLVHHKGETITKERAAELGLIAEDDVPPPGVVAAPPVRTVAVEGPPVTPTQQ